MIREWVNEINPCNGGREQREQRFCTTLKATGAGLLSCLQIKIISFRMKLK